MNTLKDCLPVGSNIGTIFAYIRSDKETNSVNNTFKKQIEDIERYVKKYSKENLDGQNTINKWFGDENISGSSDLENRPGINEFFKCLDETKILRNKKNLNVHIIIFDVLTAGSIADVSMDFRFKMQKKSICLHVSTMNSHMLKDHQILIYDIYAYTISFGRKIFLHHQYKPPKPEFGYEFIKTEIKSEQETLKLIKNMYENDKKTFSEISEFLGQKQIDKNWSTSKIYHLYMRNFFKYEEECDHKSRAIIELAIREENVLNEDISENLIEQFPKEDAKRWLPLIEKIRENFYLNN